MDIKKDKQADKVSFILIVLYLILRIILFQGIEIIFSTMPDWMKLGSELLMYIIIIALIIREKENLAQSNIGVGSIFLILIFGTFLRTPLTEEPYEIYFTLAFWVMAIYVLFSLRGIYKKKLLPIHIKVLLWIFAGTILGSVIGFLITLRLINISILSRVNDNLWMNSILFISLFIIQMGHAAIMEEPIYRGFLWGYLAQSGWKESSIWLFQAGLFWISHLTFLDSPFSFFVTAPVLSLFLGWLVWRSRSISASMFAHASFNLMVVFLNFLNMQ